MAIKVNGTTVINDSRALSNIASVDATTATAIGNAGVGGASTLISDSVSVGTGTTFSVSFSGSYRAYRLLLNGVRSGSNFDTLRWRYTDASGTAMTTQTYATSYRNKTTNTERFTTFMYIDEYYRQYASIDKVYMDMYIFNPNSTTETTWSRGFYCFTADMNNLGSFTAMVSPHYYGVGANSSVYFFGGQGGNFAAGTYSLWGIN